MITLKQEKVILKTTEKLAPVLLGVFGSYARNEQTPESDLDLLIDFKQRMNLIDLIGLEQDLTELLGVKVDLVTVKSVNNSLKPFIEKDLIRLI